jgi:hypothetical protein
MTTHNVSILNGEVNPQFHHGEQRIVARARRKAKKNGLMLRKSRRKFRNAGNYRLTATVVVAGAAFDLLAEDVIRICDAAEKRENPISDFDHPEITQCKPI